MNIFEHHLSEIKNNFLEKDFLEMSQIDDFKGKM